MSTRTNPSLIVAIVLVAVLFLLFGGGALSGGMTHGGMNGGANGGGWMGDRSWMWTPAILALGLGVVLGWVAFKKRG